MKILKVIIAACFAISLSGSQCFSPTPGPDPKPEPTPTPTDKCAGIVCGEHGKCDEGKCDEGKCECLDNYSGPQCKTPPAPPTPPEPPKPVTWGPWLSVGDAIPNLDQISNWSVISRFDCSSTAGPMTICAEENAPKDAAAYVVWGVVNTDPRLPSDRMGKAEYFSVPPSYVEDTGNLGDYRVRKAASE